MIYQLIFQDASDSLDPRQSTSGIIGEPLLVQRLFSTKREYFDKVEELFIVVELDPKMIDRYPREFSSGQRQRIGIARALAC